MGTLYIVGTPIGNLGDMTFRAVETLKSVDFICAEDTRVTAKLLNHFEIKKPMIICDKYNEADYGETICDRIIAGENAAIVTDAGMPCISDPGEKLVKLCAEKGICVAVVPGPTACVSALAVSGLDTSGFSFEGFLSVTNKQRISQLAAAAQKTNTLIFYEAPHKLPKTLEDMLKYFGDRRITVCRELTKLHEEIIRTTISGAIEHFKQNAPRGEFVLVIEGSTETVHEEEQTIDDALQRVKALAENGMRPADACREIAKVSPFSKGELYSAYLGENKK